MSKQTFPTATALATSCAAFEHNQQSIVRLTTRLEGEQVSEANRKLITDYLNGRGGPFVVKDIHYEQANEIISYLQQIGMMQTLVDGKCNNFLGNIVQLLSNETIPERELGIIAWAPKVAADYKKKEVVRSESAYYEQISKFVGQIGNKVTVKFTLIESRYINKVDSYVVYGRDEHGNLITYWTKNGDKVVKQGTIEGRVKLHNVDPQRNKALVTNLHYVKVV
jgi:hypothetical protein